MDNFEKQLAEEMSGTKTNTQAQKHSGINWGVMSVDDLTKILGETIKKDDVNKVLVFLCQLLAFTENDQFNIAFNSPSSSGKSYLAIEVASLFPEDSIIDLAYASPASFFHLNSDFDKETKTYSIDLERKILIFLDQPHFQLMERLRPLLSHDKKIIKVKIVDKKKFGITTKEINLMGHSAVVFCSATFGSDEQEQTRMLFLSPETSQEKIRQSVLEVIKKETNPLEYYKKLNENPERQELMERILAIREAGIQLIKLHDDEKLVKMFFKRNKVMKPRHSRDVKRIISIAKGLALLNLWHRDYNPDSAEITTNDEDYKSAFKLYDNISLSQDYGISPYLLNVFKEVILPAYKEKGMALKRQEVLKKYYDVYGRHLQEQIFRKEIIPTLENSGLIAQERNSDDLRGMLLYPLVDTTIFTASKDKKSTADTPLSQDDIDEILDDVKNKGGEKNV